MDGSFNMAGLYVHCFFSMVAVVGVVLLVAWMIKNLKPEKLLWWAVGLTIVGLLGALITVQYEVGFFQKMAGKMETNHKMNKMSPMDRDFSAPVPGLPMQPGMMMKMMTQQNLP